MSFSRTKYDKCECSQEIERSVAPGNYKLFPGFADNCNKCNSMCTPINSNVESSTARSNCEEGFGSVVEVESDLTNRNNVLNNCNKNKKIKKVKMYTNKPCNSFLEGEDTRFTNPIDNYRGMSLTPYFFEPYLHVNPQCNVSKVNPFPSRLLIDEYVAPIQNPWDNFSYPPKTKDTVNSCKVCCK